MKPMTSGAPSNRNGKKRYAKKRKKMDTLQLVSSSEMHSIERTLLKSTKVFFSGTTKTTLQNTITNSLTLSAIVDLEVVDTKEGARIELMNQDTVFTLIP
jgi:ferredoxin-fold anticodon binding domain-containing protein